MAATVARLQAVLSADTTDFDRGMNRSEHKMGGFAKAAVLGLGAAGAAGAVAFLKHGWDELAQAQQVSAQTEAVLKSTGGAAKVTAGQIGDLASQIMRKSGIDDEAIQSGENMLLTFKNIRNETGKGNDIFNQSTSILADMSTALGTDMPKQAIQLGKALNDPVKGISALSRVGVTFTEDQKKMVKGMVESGNTMGAQKLILKELNSEFGGSAEALGKTLPGQINIAKETFSNFSGEVVAKMIPAITAAVNYVRDHWPEIKQTIIDAWAAIKPVLDAFGGLVKTVAGIIQEHRGTIERNFNAIKTVVGDALKIVRGAIQLVVDLLHGDWDKAWKDAKLIVSSVIDGIKTLLTNQLENVKSLALGLGRAAYNGLTEGITGVGAFFLGVIVGLKDMLVNQLDDMKTKATNLGAAVLNGIVSGVTGVRGAVWGIVSGIGTKFLEMIDVVKGWGSNVGGWIRGATVDVITGLPGAIWTIFAGLPLLLKDHIDDIKEWGTKFAGWIKDAIVDGIGGLGDALYDKIKDEIGSIPGAGIAKSIAGKVGIGSGGSGDASGGGIVGPIGGGNFGGNFGGNLHGALPVMEPFAAQAAKYGLVVTAGKDDHDKYTVHGTISDHWYGKALDVSNGVNTPQEAAFFRSLIGNPRVKQAFFDPLGSIFDGVLSSYVEGGHTDHVHVATYDKGGWLQPGLTLAYNGLGRPEAVGGVGGNTTVVNVYGSLIHERELDGRIREGILREQNRGRRI